MRIWVMLAMVACSRAGGPEPGLQPTVPLVPLEPSALCVTMGTLAGRAVDAPTFRAVALGHTGDAASLRFRVRGNTAERRALASGQLRRQLGLKLRASDGCNLVYAMWRIDPKPQLEVSVKRNPGARTAKECGNRGYAKLVPSAHAELPSLEDDTEHELRAEITGSTLTAWIDGSLVWRGTLPDVVHDMDGAPGVRSDNLSFDISAVSVDSRQAANAHATCHPENIDE